MTAPPFALTVPDSKVTLGWSITGRLPVSSRLSTLSLVFPLSTTPVSFALPFLEITVVPEVILLSPEKTILVTFSPSTMTQDFFAVEKSTLSSVRVEVAASQLQPSSSFFWSFWNPATVRSRVVVLCWFAAKTFIAGKDAIHMTVASIVLKILVFFIFILPKYKTSYHICIAL